MKNQKISSMTLCWTVLLLVFSTNSCSNQNPSKPPIQDTSDTKKEEFQHLKFTSGIRSILEDSQGRIWFGSHQEGVALFNGVQFTYFSKANGLSDNQIRSIYEAENGEIWFEGGEGVSRYGWLGITTYRERNYDAKEAWNLNESDLWFKSDPSTGHNQLEGHPGVYQWDGQALSYRSFPVQPKGGEENYYSVTTPFVKGKNGTVWFGTYGGAIGYDGSNFKVIDSDYLGLTEESGFLHLRSLLEDSQGNLWIGNNGIGVFKYDGEKAVHFTQKHQLTKADTKGNSLERVFSIGEDASGNIWFGTYESGVWRYDGETLTNFTEKDGLASRHIWTIYKSKGGALWFGGADPSGVYQFNGDSFERKY
jgi:ligand-binding sensor domain-containing protein